jgi:2-dehydropantoate 2-reductase
MRILIVGAGAVGGYFGARLAQSGRDVTFLVRPRRAERLKADGLKIISPKGNVTIVPRLAITGAVSSSYDIILLAVKAYALDQATIDFAPAVGSNTMIVPFLNGMRHLDLLTAQFGSERVSVEQFHDAGFQGLDECGFQGFASEAQVGDRLGSRRWRRDRRRAGCPSL